MPRKEDDLSKKERNAVARMITNIVGKPELKQFAYSRADISPVSSATGNKLYLNWCRGPATVTAGVVDTTPFQQGPGGYQRLGNEILIHECDIHFELSSLSVTAFTSTVRVMLIYEYYPENVTIAPADFIYDVGAGNFVRSPYKQNGMGTIRVLYDKRFSVKMEPGTTSATSWNVFPSTNVSIKKKFKRPLHTVYYPDAAAATEVTGLGIQKGALICIIVSDQANVLMSQGYSNILFTDA